MSDQQTKSVLKLPTRDLVKAGANAPAVLVREVVQRRGSKLSAEAEGYRRSADFDVEEYVDRLIKRQLMLVRGQGALAGLAVVASEAVAASETVDWAAVRRRSLRDPDSRCSRSARREPKRHG